MKTDTRQMMPRIKKNKNKKHLDFMRYPKFTYQGQKNTTIECNSILDLNTLSNYLIFPIKTL
jgi:hypothetical protein